MSNNAALEQALKETIQKLEELHKYIEELNTAGSLHYGIVLQTKMEKSYDLKRNILIAVVIDGKAGVRELVVPPNFNKLLNIGDIIAIGDSGNIVRAVSNPLMQGEVVTIKSVINTALVEVDLAGTSKVVFSGKFHQGLEYGEQVILDPTNSIIINKLAKKPAVLSDYGVNTAWDDIGGLEHAKTALREIIELPYTHSSIYNHYRKKPTKGVLLYGPPGCGKTLLAKAMVTALAKIHNSNPTKESFTYIKGPEILDKYVGVTESSIRQIFHNAKIHKVKAGWPAVVFIDEADALLSKRGSNISSGINNTVVPMFLTEMDGLQGNSSIVILATNRPDTLDSAIIRDGRIDRKIRIGRPDKVSAQDIFRINLQKLPLSSNLTMEKLSFAATEELFNEKRVLYKVKTQSKVHNMTLPHILNGGMISNIVDLATTKAMHRDIANKGKKSGLIWEDMLCAIDELFFSNQHLDHSSEVLEFSEELQEPIVDITKYFKMF